MTQKHKRILLRTLTITEILVVLLVPAFLVLITSGLVLTRHTHAERPLSLRDPADLKSLAQQNMPVQSFQYDILFDTENKDALAELKTYDAL